MPNSSAGLRTYHRKRLNAFLKSIDDEGFFQLLWAGDALQSDREKAAAPYLTFNYPREAVTTDMISRYYIQKWEIETLANEALVVPKDQRRGKLYVNSFENLLRAVNLLKRLENDDAARNLNDATIFRELARIANRQFDWQRGYLNVPQFYRNAYIYGQGICAEYFEKINGISINEFSLVGFGLFAFFKSSPAIYVDSDFSQVGISSEKRDRAFHLLSAPYSRMKALARQERSGIYHTAYRPSLFRRYPCIEFQGANRVLRSPLPQLILERVTNGVFYDIVSGGGTVRNEYAKRFEDYSHAFLQAMLPGLNWSRETQYLHRRNSIATPDILVQESNEVEVAIECKATRMGYGAKFGDDELDERGFQDIVKAVFQLWRFFSHCRRGISPYSLAQNAVGCVLTLDNWLLMAESQVKEVLAAARRMAAERDPEITVADQRPVCFSSVTDLEHTAREASEEGFMATLRSAADGKYFGWMLSSVHTAIGVAKATSKSYPFTKDLSALLPWWSKVGKNSVETLV